jgi:hypothetical protein
MLKMLKVKVKSLAAEARIIRLEEYRAKGQVRTSLLTGETDPRVYGRDDALRVSLYFHRTKDVRGEQRSALLAYAFLRDVPLCKVEPKRRSDPDWARVHSIVLKFGEGACPTKAELAQKLKDWQAAASPTG